MRRMMAIAFGCALMIGVNIASSGTTVRERQPSTHAATSADGAEVHDASQALPACVQASDGIKIDQVSQVPPACVQASQCVDYCAGGIPLCVAKHCSCAS
jgi:hypothetical protein